MESRDKAETIRNEKVVNCLYQNRNALFRLVCFPWGGGGSNFFAKWGQDIPNSVEGTNTLPWRSPQNPCTRRREPCY
ncbi:S-acyl fatty acid synthase thioesterase, medium chain-like [Cervus canadensis]|uniref:S-acyl fatty acid synthase thioesterase, medium chain-like n=1 Tax=Cervus canadensis TaxID=1574408 RepID=UPI001C9E8366|nr:S-acyl fatty acid synthase thioesterase, medium chain-like [Cervus canadensis]